MNSENMSILQSATIGAVLIIIFILFIPFTDVTPLQISVADNKIVSVDLRTTKIPLSSYIAEYLQTKERGSLELYIQIYNCQAQTDNCLIVNQTLTGIAEGLHSLNLHHLSPSQATVWYTKIRLYEFLPDGNKVFLDKIEKTFPWS